MADLAQVRYAFENATEFNTSPLYQALSKTVAATDDLLRLAARARPGQYPTFVFFGAVHHVLLRGVDHDLAAFYPSIVGERARPAEDAGPALVSFCARYEPDLTRLLQTRLVQTNHVQRALGLRLGLSVISREVSQPVHLVEVGAPGHAAVAGGVDLAGEPTPTRTTFHRPSARRHRPAHHPHWRRHRSMSDHRP
jgi:hypothetical protein